MPSTMEPVLAFRVHAHEAPALELRVNFGVFAGRNATPAEIDDLARQLRRKVSRFTVIAEARHEFGDDVETSLHQLVIEIDGPEAEALSDEDCGRILELTDRWATSCIDARSELGELRET